MSNIMGKNPYPPQSSVNDVQTVLPKTVAKSPACLSYVNDPRAFAARNTIDQLAGDARKKP